MIVIVPKTSGFCPGVQKAEEGVFKLRKTHDKVHLHGPLIHNQKYTEMLINNRINTVDVNTLSHGETIVIRTHGIPKQEEEILSNKFNLIDLTCSIVKSVQKKIAQASDEGAFIIISGKPKHAEVQGLVSYANHFSVIENLQELDDFLNNYHHIIPQSCSKIFILSQTTYSRSFFANLCLKIQEQITHLPIEIKDTICPITENKEKESLMLQKEVDFTVVIGDISSSNSKKLFAILKEGSEQTIFVSHLQQLQDEKKDWSGIEKVLIVSSTSTPKFLEQEIVTYLQQL